MAGGAAESENILGGNAGCVISALRNRRGDRSTFDASGNENRFVIFLSPSNPRYQIFS
jgi:hypothetical protein